MMNFWRSIRLPLTIVLVITALDQVTKALVLQRIELYERIVVIPELFNLTLIYNPGAAFGLFGSLPELPRKLILFTVTIVALYVLWRMYKDAQDDLIGRYTPVIILGGAIGNLIDRIRFGSVVDFLDFYIGELHWPAFNIADSAISLGVCLLIYRIIFPYHKQGADLPTEPLPTN